MAADFVGSAPEGNRRARRQADRPGSLGQLARDPFLFTAREIQRMRQAPARRRGDADFAGGGIDLDDHPPGARIEAHAHFQHPAIDLEQFMADCGR